MFNNLSGTNVATLSDEEAAGIFDEVDENAGSKKKAKPVASTDNDDNASDDDDDQSTKTKKGKTKDKSSKDKSDLGPKKVTPSTLSDDDAEELFPGEEDDDDDDDEETKKRVVGVNGEEEEDDDDAAEENDDDDDDEDTASEDDVKDFLKARVNLLIKRGEWADFEGRDKAEWDEESFADMEIQQRELQREQMREDLLDKFGPYGRQITEYAENGGDPDTLIDIFKEQQKAEALSVETEEAQKRVVFKYETEFLGKKPERVNKYIDSLITDKSLKEEAEDAKESMEKHWKAEAKNAIAEQQASVEAAKEREKQSIARFQQDVSAEINRSKDIPDGEKPALLKMLTKFDKKLPNGSFSNEIPLRLAAIRKNLPQYIQLARFLQDPAKFIKGQQQTGASKTAEKDFNLLRTANKSKKVKGRDLPNSGKAPKGTKFKLY